MRENEEAFIYSFVGMGFSAVLNPACFMAWEFSERHDYCIVEVISIDPNIGEELGKVLWLCDNLEEALDTSISLEGVDSMVLPGLACYSVLGVCFV